MLLCVKGTKNCCAGSTADKMSLALQQSPQTENSSLGTQLVTGVEATGVDDSSTLADLVSMFPSVDHDVAVMVLEVHNGSLEAAVEYLLTNKGNGSTTQPAIGGYERLSYLDPAHDMVGQFSADIGGLPEVLPRYLYDEMVQEEGEGEENEVQVLEPQKKTPNWLEETDPLPTYAEACTNRSARGYSPEESSGDDHSTLTPVEGISGKQPAGASSSSKKKGKKLFKIASKLNPRRKSSVGKFKAQEKRGSDGLASQQYQPLIDGDELQDHEI